MPKKNPIKKVMEHIPKKTLNEIMEKMPRQNFEKLLANSLKVATCGVEKCYIETMKLHKIKAEKDSKLLILNKKFQEKKITQQKYQEEFKDIHRKFHNADENVKFKECTLKNCFDLMKNQLHIMIDTLLIKYKNDKENLIKIKAYQKLFNKKNIYIKDVKAFYNDYA